MLKRKDYIIIGVAIVFILFSSYSEMTSNSGMLFFCFFIQIQMILGTIREIKKNQSLKHAPQVQARLIKIRKIRGYEDSIHNYEGHLSFLWEEKLVEIIYQFSSLQSPVEGKIYLLKINTKNVDESFVVENFNLFGKYKIFISSILFIALCYADYFFVSKLWFYFFPATSPPC